MEAIDDHGNLMLFPIDSVMGKIESDTAWRPAEAPRWMDQVQHRPGPFAAVDFETFYTSKYSLSKMPTYEFVAHPSFNAYLVALYVWDGYNWWVWVGHPSQAPWASIAQLPWVSHNASFDELVGRRLVSDGIIARGTIPELWDCTSDLAAYLQLDRGLDAVAPALIGEKADKSIRADMKAGTANPLAIKNYASTDSRQCAWIWFSNKHVWPEQEQFLSRMQRRAGYYGVWADQETMRVARLKMREVQRKIMWQIPWANKHTVAGTKGMKIECAKLGIEVPPSLSLDDPETIIWQKRYGSRVNWLEDIRTYTKARQTETHIVQMQERTRKDGTIPFELIYRKAPHTARWQSGGGLRMMNLDKDEFEGVSVRHFIHARPGYKFLIADLNQIEPRVLNWLVGDQAFLDSCARGLSPYDAHARATMDYREDKPLKKFNPGLYALAKARVLALGYQAGPPKFCEMARTQAGIIVFEDESSYCPNPQDIGQQGKTPEFFRASQIKDRIARNDLAGWAIFPPAVEAVEDFRNRSKLIVDDWKTGQEALRRSVGGDHFVELPNGSFIRYFDVKETRVFNQERNRWESELTAWVIKNSKNPKQKKYLYGGKLTENRVQRISRDVLADLKYRVAHLAPKRLRVLWSVYDEIIAEVPIADANILFDEMISVMKIAPVWAPGLPLSAEGQISDYYIK